MGYFHHVWDGVLDDVPELDASQSFSRLIAMSRQGGKVEVVNGIAHRQCLKCLSMLPLTSDFFHRNCASKNGLHTICKECRVGHVRLHYANTVVNRQASRQEWILKRTRDAKRRAVGKGLDFDLDFSLIDQPDFCPIFGVELSYETNTGNGKQDNAASLDRIDSLKGYTNDNVRVISWKANRLKSNSTPEEIIKLFQSLNLPAVCETLQRPPTSAWVSIY